MGQIALCFFPWQATPAFGLYYKSFTIVIYNRNDSGQYYKSTITIIIYEPYLAS
jgi:hypothetical protein